MRPDPLQDLPRACLSLLDKIGDGKDPLRRLFASIAEWLSRAPRGARGGAEKTAAPLDAARLCLTMYVVVRKTLALLEITGRRSPVQPPKHHLRARPMLRQIEVRLSSTGGISNGAGVTLTMFRIPLRAKV